MTKPNISTLADRVEAGTEPIAKLLAEAFKALHPKPQNIWANKARTEWTAEYDAYHILSWQFSHLLEARGFIDAAMLLVPETCLVVLKHLWAKDGKREWYATANTYRDNMWVDSHDALNPSAALALAAASIRAHAAKEPTL